MVGYVAPSYQPNVFLSVRYRVTRATGSDPAVIKGGVPPCRSLAQLLEETPEKTWCSSVAARVPHEFIDPHGAPEKNTDDEN